uniref:rhotekin-2-like n=1 Tax=Myxine glutinosa TaxID=7769 RepID=UPI00358DDDC4
MAEWSSNGNKEAFPGKGRLCGGRHGQGALRMELRRGGARQSLLDALEPDPGVEEVVVRALRVRAGAQRLAAVSSRGEQAVAAVAVAQAAEGRARAGLARLEAHRQECVRNLLRSRDDGVKKEKHLKPCPGQVSISDITVSLRWAKPKELTKNGQGCKMAMFCLLELGNEVQETNTFFTHPGCSHLCFCGPPISFSDAPPSFSLHLSLFCCTVPPDSVANGFADRASSRKEKTMEKTATTVENWENLPPFDPNVLGPKFTLLARTSLGMQDVGMNAESIPEAQLIALENSQQFPLPERITCHLSTVPTCLTHPAIAGYLEMQEKQSGFHVWTQVYCLLQGGRFLVYFSPTEQAAQVPPIIVLLISLDFQIIPLARHITRRPHCFRLFERGLVSKKTALEGGDTLEHSLTLAADSDRDLLQWKEAFKQHLFDMDSWAVPTPCSASTDNVPPTKPPRLGQGPTPQAGLAYQILLHLPTATEPSSSPSWAPIFSDLHTKVVSNEGERLQNKRL